jgi:dihydroceramidase
MIFITAYYHYIKDPKFHQNAYAILTATVLLRSMYVMEINLRPSLRRRQAKHKNAQKENKVTPTEAAEQNRQDVRDQKILVQQWGMIAYGIVTFLGAFGIWQLDNIFCSDIRRWRQEMGLPWGILLEGHGWWHIGTGKSSDAHGSHSDLHA